MSHQVNGFAHHLIVVKWYSGQFQITGGKGACGMNREFAEVHVVTDQSEVM